MERIAGNFHYGVQTLIRIQRAGWTFSGEQRMSRRIILVAFVAIGALVAGAASAGQSDGGKHNMDCADYMAMNEASQTASVNSMRSRMPAANKMPSSHKMAKKVAANCKDHPGLMVHEVMENVMPH
jgi:hypothetical protein